MFTARKDGWSGTVELNFTIFSDQITDLNLLQDDREKRAAPKAQGLENVISPDLGDGSLVDGDVTPCSKDTGMKAR